jgi:hypothetical protein
MEIKKQNVFYRKDVISHPIMNMMMKILKKNLLNFGRKYIRKNDILITQIILILLHYNRKNNLCIFDVVSRPVSELMGYILMEIMFLFVHFSRH